MGHPEASGDRRGLLLVRGGVLTPFSGLGGAFHDLRLALESQAMAPWVSVGTLEYDLGDSASPWRRLTTRWFRHPRTVSKTVQRLHEEGSVDLVLVSDQEQAHLVPASSPVPVAVYVHDLFHLFPTTVRLSGSTVHVGEQHPSLVRRRDLRRVLKGLKRANAFICSTNAIAEQCRIHFPSTPLFQIPYALEVGRYAPPDVLPERPETLSAGTCHLLVVGSHDPRKRLSFLTDVLSGLPEDMAKDVLVHHIGGDACPEGGPAASKLAEQKGVHWHHVGDNISDEVLNVHRWYCEALLFPSGAEGFGYPPVESMAAGQPVLASDRAAHNELMPPGTCLDPEDVNAWRQAIAEVHATWKGREGAHREPDKDLMEHVSFLAPERFHQAMSEAWSSICSS